VVATFVSVGNAIQPFNRLTEGVLKIAFKLPQPVFVQHGNTPFPQDVGCITKPFIEMGEFSQCVAQADLLILHAGAGSVIHAVRAGKVPVVMPRRAKYGEHVDDHQVEFARALAGAGKVIMVEEPEGLFGAVEVAMERQYLLQPLSENSRMISLIGEVLHEYATVSKR
jgi:beta-1,4-N-acetylglucosaminyltransferase